MERDDLKHKFVDISSLISSTKPLRDLH